MTKQEFIKLEREYGLRSALYEIESNELWTYEDLKLLAIKEINDDNIFMALHILNYINNCDDEDIFRYDRDMGTLQAPYIISGIEDIEDLLD